MSILSYLLILLLIVAFIVHATLVNAPPGLEMEDRNDDQERTGREDEESADYSNNKPIVFAVNRLVKEIHRQRYENKAKEYPNKVLKVLEVAGLWAAALVGMGAVIIANEDAFQQRGTMEKEVKALGDQLDAMVADQRPWLKISAAPGSLKFDPSSGNATIQYGLRIENVGRSVAVQARIHAKVITVPSNQGGLDFVGKTEESYCADEIANAATVNMDKINDGINLFPREFYPTHGVYYGGATNLSKQEIIGAALPMAKPNDGVFFRAFLIGCVTYKLNIGDKRHQTGLIDEIDRVEPTSDLPLLLKSGMDLTPPNLAFPPWFFGSGKID